MDSCVSHSAGLLVKLDQNNHKLSYHDWRNELKKLKRKARRKTIAQLRDSSLSETNGSTENQTVSGEEENDEDERQRQLQNELWLEREKASQALFLAKKDREERERQQKEDEQKKIKEEWEQQQRKQKEDEEKQKNDKERRKEEMNRLQKRPTDDCHNPPAPPNYNAESQELKNCPFFQKVGACRFGLNCKRAHNVPETSTTILFPGMFAHFELEQSFRDEFDSDLTLEYEEGDIYDEFKLFYEDVFPEFQAVGHVIQFVVCCNYEPHLRGNVYAQYASKDEALSAYEKFNGRWYNKRQLSCQFTSVDNWKSAICGLFRYKKCPKGKNCNFLHVFQNPVDKYSENMSDLRRRRRRSSSVHGPEPSRKQLKIKSTLYQKSSSSRKKTYASSKSSRHRSASKSPPCSHRKRQKSWVHRHSENIDTGDQTTSHRISGSSSRKRDRLSSSTYHHESSGSSSDSYEYECESSRNKYRKYSSHVHHRGHSRTENANTDSVRHDKSLKSDSELGNSRIKTGICLKETDLPSEDKSSSSKFLENDGCAKYRNENGCTERRSKRSKDHHSKNSKTKTTKKFKLE